MKMIMRVATTRGRKWQVKLRRDTFNSFAVEYYKGGTSQGHMCGLPTEAAGNAEFDRHVADSLRYDGIQYIEA